MQYAVLIPTAARMVLSSLLDRSAHPVKISSDALQSWIGPSCSLRAMSDSEANVTLLAHTCSRHHPKTVERIVRRSQALVSELLPVLVSPGESCPPCDACRGSLSRR